MDQDRARRFQLIKSKLGNFSFLLKQLRAAPWPRLVRSQVCSMAAADPEIASTAFDNLRGQALTRTSQCMHRLECSDKSENALKVQAFRKHREWRLGNVNQLYTQCG